VAGHGGGDEGTQRPEHDPVEDQVKKKRERRVKVPSIKNSDRKSSDRTHRQRGAKRQPMYRKKKV